MIELREGLFAHASGCVWWRPGRVLFAADLHLGYAWAQLRRGELAPPVADNTVARIVEAARELEPGELVLLGDIVHAPNPALEEWRLIEDSLATLTGCAQRLTLVAGNHDRGFTRQAVAEWRAPGLLAVHGHRLPSAADRAAHHCLYGHWHPSSVLRDAAGVNHRLRAFVHTDAATVLPAQTSFSTGFHLKRPWPEDLREALGEGRARYWVTTGRALKGPYSR